MIVGSRISLYTLTIVKDVNNFSSPHMGTKSDNFLIYYKEFILVRFLIYENSKTIYESEYLYTSIDTLKFEIHP